MQVTPLGTGSAKPLRLRYRDLAVTPARKRTATHAVHECAPRHNTSTHQHVHSVHSFIHSFVRSFIQVPHSSTRGTRTHSVGHGHAAVSVPNVPRALLPLSAHCPSLSCVSFVTFVHAALTRVSSVSTSVAASGVPRGVLWERALASLPPRLSLALRDAGLTDTATLLNWETSWRSTRRSFVWLVGRRFSDPSRFSEGNYGDGDPNVVAFPDGSLGIWPSTEGGGGDPRTSSLLFGVVSSPERVKLATQTAMLLLTLLNVLLVSRALQLSSRVG